MNTADPPSKNEGTKVCPEGRELMRKAERLDNTYRAYKRLHMLIAVKVAFQAYRQHVDNECDVCRTSTKGIRYAHKEE
jgi:hypothetical protein